jgi:hypothetical protein
MAKRKKPRKHLCNTGKYDGVLSRNGTYRDDARGHLKGTGIYDNVAQIAVGVRRQRSVARLTPAKQAAEIAKKVPKYTFDHGTNFTWGGHPYGNQAHHILVCEVFYDKKWTADHLDVVLECDYDINNPKNIIYLPTDYAKEASDACYYHNLPNHGWNHPAYNKTVSRECDYIFDLVEQAVDAAKKNNCEDTPDILDAIKSELKRIEKVYFAKIRSAGPRAMPA